MGIWGMRQIHTRDRVEIRNHRQIFAHRRRLIRLSVVQLARGNLKFELGFWGIPQQVSREQLSENLHYNLSHWLSSAFTQWFRTSWNRDSSIGPLAHPLAHSLAPLTRLLAPHCSLCSSAPHHSFVRSRAHSLAPELMGQWWIFVQIQSVLKHCVSEGLKPMNWIKRKRLDIAGDRRQIK